MRWIVVVVGVVVAIGLVTALVRPNGLPGGGADGPTAAAPGPAASRNSAERGSLARLREEIDRAAPVQGRDDAQRIAEAMAWVGANRPADWPYADLEAGMLALYMGLGDGQKRSAAWVIDVAGFEVEMTRALDADRDGLVSGEEVSAFADFLLLHFDPESHPYLLGSFDPDGDGATGLGDLAGMFYDRNVIDGIVARVQADLWDTDGDGSLSESESAAGRERMLLQAKIFGDGHVEYVESPGPRAAQEQAAVLATMSDQFGDAAAAFARRLQESSAPAYLSSAFIRSIRLEEQIAAGEPDPAPHAIAPDAAAYDDDGDGQLSDAERAAFMDAWEAYGKELDRANALREALRKLAHFDAAAAEGDMDGDGRFSPEEWEAHTDHLLAERASRLFLRHYDLDGSGRVDAAELDAFLSWYRGASLRADANYDGRLDALDLEAMAAGYERQGD